MLTSLSLIEDFYGESVTPGLLGRVRTTPSYQLAELADRLQSLCVDTNSTLLSRSGFVPVRYGPDPPTAHHILQPILESPLAVYDELLSGNSDGAFAKRGQALKGVLLYYPTIMVPDPCLDWAMIYADRGYERGGHPSANDGVDGGELASGLAFLAPLRPLINSGAIILAPGEGLNLSSDQRDTWGALWYMRNDLRGPHDHSYSVSSDPYLASVILRSVAAYEEWEIDLLEIASPADMVDAAWEVVRSSAIYPEIADRLRCLSSLAHPGASEEQFFRSVALSLVVRRAKAVPVTSDPVVTNHLIASTSNLLDVRSESRGFGGADVGKALSFDLPNLDHVSLSDVVKLRSDEETFELVRSSLSALTASVASASRDSGLEFRREVRERALDLVQPSLEKLRSESFRKSVLASIVGFGVGKAVDLTLSGILTLVGGPPGHVGKPLSKKAGGLAGKSVRKALDSNSDARRIAETLLISML